MEGVPTLLVRHGRVEWKGLHHERMDIEALMTAIREHGLRRLEDVDLAVLELDGSISIIGNREAHASALRRRKRRHVKFTRLS